MQPERTDLPRTSTPPGGSGRLLRLPTLGPLPSE